MTPAARTHFQRSFRVPFPWVRFGTSGRTETRIEESFTLRRIACTTKGKALKRSAIRAVLDEELQLAAGRPVPWRESPNGPEILEPLGGVCVKVSISYASSEAWLALGWESPIGVDAVGLEPVPDWKEVASVYLEPCAQERLHKSTRPALDFAREWAGFEARLKLGGCALKEGVSPPPALLFEATFNTVTVAVALNPGAKKP
jgi:phosphopantetheinyl transferase